MAKLNIKTNLKNHDAVYQILIDMHQGLSDEESQLVNSKLILTLVNHIGDEEVIAEAINVARENTLLWRNETQAT